MSVFSEPGNELAFCPRSELTLGVSGVALIDVPDLEQACNDFVTDQVCCFIVGGMLKDRYRETLSQKHKCNFVYSTGIVTIDPAKHTDVKSGTYVFLNCTGALSQAETVNTVKLEIPDMCECRVEYHEPKEEDFGSKEWQTELKKLRDVVIPAENIFACRHYET